MQCLGMDAGGTSTRVVAIGETDLQDADAIGQEHVLGPGNFRLLTASPTASKSNGARNGGPRGNGRQRGRS